MKALHDFAKTLSDALAAVEGAKAAEERARDARLAEGRARSELEAAKSEAARIKSEADTYHENSKKASAEARCSDIAAIAAERAQHAKWLADTKRVADEESERLTELKASTAAEQLRHDELVAAIAKHRASLAELAAKF
jgi:hypothetical protein